MFNLNRRKEIPQTDLAAFIRRLREAHIASVGKEETDVYDLTCGLTHLDAFIKEDLPSSTKPLEVVEFNTLEKFRKKVDAVNKKLGHYQKLIADGAGLRPEVPLSVCSAAERVIVEEFPEAAYAGDIRKNATLRLKLLRLGALMLTSLTSFLGRISGRVEVPSFGASYAELRNQLARAYRNLDWGTVFEKFISPLLTEDDVQTLNQVLENATRGGFKNNKDKMQQAVQFLTYFSRKLKALYNLSKYVEANRQEQFLELQRKLLEVSRTLLIIAQKNGEVEERLAEAIQLSVKELCSFNPQLLKTIIRSEIIDPFVSKYCNLWSIFCYVMDEQGAYILSLKIREDQRATIEARLVEAIQCPFSGPLAREVSKRVNA